MILDHFVARATPEERATFNDSNNAAKGLFSCIYDGCNADNYNIRHFISAEEGFSMAEMMSISVDIKREWAALKAAADHVFEPNVPLL